MNSIKNKFRFAAALTAIAAVVGLAGCATNDGYSNSYPAQTTYRNTQPTPYQTAQSYNRYEQNVRYGTVYSVRSVALNSGTSGVGIGVGAVAGGVLGNQIGGGSGNTAATVLGAIGGGYLGNEIEKRNARTAPGLEIQVQMDGTREIMTVVQPDQGQGFRNGSRVRLVEENGHWVATY